MKGKKEISRGERTRGNKIEDDRIQRSIRLYGHSIFYCTSFIPYTKSSELSTHTASNGRQGPSWREEGKKREETKWWCSQYKGKEGGHYRMGHPILANPKNLKHFFFLFLFFLSLSFPQENFTCVWSGTLKNVWRTSNVNSSPRTCSAQKKSSNRLAECFRFARLVRQDPEAAKDHFTSFWIQLVRVGKENQRKGSSPFPVWIWIANLDVGFPPAASGVAGTAGTAASRQIMNRYANEQRVCFPYKASPLWEGSTIHQNDEWKKETFLGFPALSPLSKQ